MIVINATEEELRAASGVAPSITLQSISLCNLSIENKLCRTIVSESTQFEADIRHSSEEYEILEDKILVSLVNCVVEFRKVKKQDKVHSNEISKDSDDSNLDQIPPDVSIDITYAARYLLPTPPIPDKVRNSALPAFAKHNGLLNCWPYIRREVQQTSGEIGLPLLLPLLRIQRETSDSSEE